MGRKAGLCMISVTNRQGGEQQGGEHFWSNLLVEHLEHFWSISLPASSSLEQPAYLQIMERMFRVRLSF